MEKKKTSAEVKEKVGAYITGAFGLVGALAWNDAVSSFINAFFAVEKNSLIAKFIYAVAISIFVVLMSIYLSRLFNKK